MIMRALVLRVPSEGRLLVLDLETRQQGRCNHTECTAVLPGQYHPYLSITVS